MKAYYNAVGTDFEGFSQKFGPAVENVLGAGGVKELAGDARLLQET